MSSSTAQETRRDQAIHDLLADLVGRSCPVCGSVDDSQEQYPQRIDVNRLDHMVYASRKEPEFMSLRMVLCPICELLYAPQIPSAPHLIRAYTDSGYDSDSEADFAALSYRDAILDRIRQLPDRDSILEIGAGNGALLGHLKALGFKRLLGIEPSIEAVKFAKPELRDSIHVGHFVPERFSDSQFSLIICNQTLEHIYDPFAFLTAARRLLKPGGGLMIVSHNHRHWLMRLLGSRSPIVDVEHLQIFSPASLNEALQRAGFREVTIGPFTNRYPIHYWFRLLPIPPHFKGRIYAWLRLNAGRRIGECMLSAKVGNMIGWALAPR